jgi:hypothetical protein
MLPLVLQRTTITNKSTCGVLFVNGDQFCFTLEEPLKDGLPGSCIKAGTYNVTLAPSPKFEASPDDWERLMGKNVPRLWNVPNREYILMHWGNSAKDTEGCILVGQTIATDFIGHSRDAYTALLQKFQGESGAQLQVLDRTI